MGYSWRKAAALACITVLFLSSAAAVTSGIQADSFEDGDYTSNPSWNVLSGGSLISVTNSVAAKGSYSLKLVDDSNGSAELAYDGADSPDDWNHTIWMRTSNVGNPQAGRAFYNLAGGDKVWPFFRNNHLFCRDDNDKKTLTSSPSDNEWYRVDINVSGGKVTCTGYNDGSQVGQITLTPVGDTSLTDFEAETSDPTGEDGNFWVDLAPYEYTQAINPPQFDTLSTTPTNWSYQESVDLEVNLSHPEGDSFQDAQYRVENETVTAVAWTNFSINSNGYGSVTDAFTPDSGGNWTLDVKAYDVDGDYNQSTTVQTVDGPPYINMLNTWPENWTKGAEIDVTVEAKDNDEPQFTLNASLYDPNGSLVETRETSFSGPNYGLIQTWTEFYQFGDSGVYNLTANVSDPNGFYDVEFTAQNVESNNTAPTINSVSRSPVYPTIGDDLEATLNVSDTTNNLDSYRIEWFKYGGLTYGTTTGSISGGGPVERSIIFAQNVNETGTHTLNYSVTDTEGATTFQVVNFSVTGVEMLEPENNTVFKEGDNVPYKIRVDGPNGPVRLVENSTVLNAWNHSGGTTNYSYLRTDQNFGYYDVYGSWTNSTVNTTTNTTYFESLVQIEEDFEDGSFDECPYDAGLCIDTSADNSDFSVVSSNALEGDYLGEFSATDDAESDRISFESVNESYGETEIQFQIADVSATNLVLRPGQGGEQMGALDVQDGTVEWHPDNNVTSDGDAQSVTTASDGEVFDIRFDYDYEDNQIFLENESADSLDDNFATLDIGGQYSAEYIDTFVVQNGDFGSASYGARIDEMQFEDTNQSYTETTTTTTTTGDNTTTESQHVFYDYVADPTGVNVTIGYPGGFHVLTSKNPTTGEFPFSQYLYGDAVTDLDGNLTWRYRPVWGDTWRQFSLNGTSYKYADVSGTERVRPREAFTVGEGNSTTIEAGNEEVTFEVLNVFEDSGVEKTYTAINGQNNTYEVADVIYINGESIRMDAINLNAPSVTFAVYPSHDTFEDVYQYRLTYTTDAGSVFRDRSVGNVEGDVREDFFAIEVDGVTFDNLTEFSKTVTVPVNPEHDVLFKYGTYNGSVPDGDDLTGETNLVSQYLTDVVVHQGTEYTQTPSTELYDANDTFLRVRNVGNWEVNGTGTYLHYTNYSILDSTHGFMNLTLVERTLSNQSYQDDLEDDGYQDIETGSDTDENSTYVEYGFAKKSPLDYVELNPQSEGVVGGNINFEFIISHNSTTELDKYLFLTLPNGTVVVHDPTQSGESNSANINVDTPTGEAKWKLGVKLDGAIRNSTTATFDIRDADRATLADFGDLPDGLIGQFRYLGDLSVAAISNLTGFSQFLVGLLLSILFIFGPYAFFAYLEVPVLDVLSGLAGFVFVVLFGIMPNFILIGLGVLTALGLAGVARRWLSG